jgi:hypothetical protein
MNVEIIRDDPDHYCLSLQIRHSQIPSVISVLNLLGVPPVRPPGGVGWIIDDGSISISGTQSAVEKAVDELDYVLYGPRFETGLAVAQRHRKGALP